MPTPPGYAQVSIEFQQTGVARPAYVTFGVDPTDTDPLTVAQGIAGTCSIAGGFVALFDQTCFMTAVRVSLGTDGGEDLVGVATTALAGTTQKTSLPPNCALLVHKVTTRGGRRGRGRMFFPWCVSENNVDEAGIIDTTTLSGLQTAASAWRASMASAGNPIVILHNPSAPGTVRPTTPGPPNVVTSLVVDKLISTQRRRLGR